MDSYWQKSWSEPLDKTNQNRLFIRFKYDQEFEKIEEFAVAYLIRIKDKMHEIIRYDCSKNESVNVHYFYYKKPVKIYLDKEKSFETLEEFANSIRKNWGSYRIKYFDNKDIFI